MALFIACAVLFVIYLASRTYKYKCVAPGCDFMTDDPEAAQRHTAVHSRHKAVLQEIF
ncbi:MAG: hypothetical protein NVS2B12_40980 [Ktedonobacteraceae bacterium]